MEDIETISVNEEQRNKLFFCLEEKPPFENRFVKLEEFLKGTTNLENVTEILTFLEKDLTNICEEINSTTSRIKSVSKNVLENTSF